LGDVSDVMIAGMLNSVELADESDLADDVAELKKIFRYEFIRYHNHKKYLA